MVKLATINKYFRKLLSIVSKQEDIEILESYPEKDTLVVRVKRYEFPLMIAVVPAKEIVQIECALHFDSSLLNLKTMSSLSNILYSSGFGMTGIMHSASDLVKIYAGKEIPLAVLGNYISTDLDTLILTLVAAKDYLEYRYDTAQMNKVDISMFKDLDISNVSLRTIGERKEFVFNGWDKYLEELGGPDIEQEVKEMLMPLILACRAFEEKNSMLLSEVGEEVSEEVFLSNSKFVDKFDIN